jgi:hypothetical protein
VILLVICGSGCGVSKSDFDAVQQQRIAAEGEATKAQAELDKLKSQIEVAEAEKKKWRESAVDLSDSLERVIYGAQAGAEAFENLRIRFDGLVRPTSISPSGGRNDWNGQRLYGIAVSARTQGNMGRPPPFFVLSEALRDDLLKRGRSAGLGFADKGDSRPPWDARLFFVVRATEKRDSRNAGIPELYGQLYRIELFKSADFSGEPAVVVEDEELIANPNPPPPIP